MQETKLKQRVVVAMSGGVDSSVSAALLQKKGYDVIGVTIKTWTSEGCRDEKSKGCCSLRDIDDARSVARKIHIPFYVMDLSTDFKEKVMDTFVDEYFAGRTPNPCIECNRHIKFGLLLEKAKELGADFIATGHYARRGYDEADGRFFLQEAVDVSKDQSYVLFGLTQEQLSKTLLPIGDLHKSEVRVMAEELGLRIHDKPDSQEICFVKSKYIHFIKEVAPERLPGKGSFETQNGEVVGEHEGFHEFTIGQRKRIMINGSEPYFVTGINPKKNRVMIGPERDLFKGSMTVRATHWISEPKLGPIFVKIRSRHDKTQASIVSIQSNVTTVHFKNPQKAVTPGQAAVFYEGSRVIGGGWIG